MRLSWTPFLFAASFYGALLTILLGDPNIIPPGNVFGTVDWMWLMGALTTPFTALLSVWLIRHQSGRMRYFAFWLRIASNIGLITSILSYQVQRIFEGTGHPFEDVILFASVLYMVVLVVADVRILSQAEKLAGVLVRGGHEGR